MAQRPVDSYHLAWPHVGRAKRLQPVVGVGLVPTAIGEEVSGRQAGSSEPQARAADASHVARIICTAENARLGNKSQRHQLLHIGKCVSIHTLIQTLDSAFAVLGYYGEMRTRLFLFSWLLCSGYGVGRSDVAKVTDKLWKQE